METLEKELTAGEIWIIAELVWEKYGKEAMMPNRAVSLVSGVMREMGCTERQIDEQRIDVSRAVMQIRRENS